MIVVKLLGGMGNQMFQYAMGRSLALRHATELRLNLKHLENRTPQGPHFVFRDFDLDIFTLEARLADARDCAQFVYPDSSLAHRVRHRLKRQIWPHKYVTERSFTYSTEYLDFGRECYLEGCWASEKYFQDHEATLRQDFQFRDPLSQREEELRGRLRSVCSVAVNFRRTDFVATNTQVPLEYYQRAVEVLRARLTEPHFFVFSDDVAWCQENFAIDAPTQFVDHSYRGRKFSAYLQLMSCCRHFIIPNSTFAWWAVWLGRESGQQVVAPRVWSAAYSAQDLNRPEWILL